MEEIEVVRAKVERYAKEIFQNISIAPDGDLQFRFESTKIEIRVRHLKTWQNEEDRAYHIRHGLPTVRVDIWAFVLIDVPRSPGLFKWVATEGQNWNFGGAKVKLNDDGLAHLIFSYAISGSTLDPGELKNAALMVARTANNLDEDLQKRFGGKRFVDYIKETNK